MRRLSTQDPEAEMAANALPAWARFALELLAACPRWKEIQQTQAKSDHAISEGDLAALRERRVDSLYHILYQPEAPGQRLYDKVWVAQQAALAEAARAIWQAGINPLVFKGAEFLTAYYAPFALNLLSDVDLLF